MGTATLSLPEETLSRLQQVADQLGENVTTLAEKAIHRYIREEADRKIEQEEVHYKAQHARLLQSHAGQYIAMHEGQVIDTDNNQWELYLRIRKIYPTTGILIKKVTPQVETVFHMRSPRLEYD
jgi:hypothetical protein